MGILITGLFTAFLAVVYAGLAAAMPRTGGDYVFQSRTLKPSIGFAIVATMIPTFFLHWQALAGWLTSILGFAPLFTGLGLTMNNTQLLDLGVWFTTPFGIWITTIVSSTFAAIILIKSFRWFVLAQWVMWYGFLLSFVVMIVFFLITPTSVFIERFNAAMTVLAPGTPDYYHYVLTEAVKNGFTPVQGMSWNSTLFVLPIALTSLGWVGYAQEQAGEIQGASSLKNQLFINLGGGLFSTVLMMILAYTFISTVGQGWLAAAAYGNFLTGTVNMPIPPWFSNLAAVLTDNPILVFLMIIGILLNALQIVFNVIVGWTRVTVAMSIDGVLPKFLSNVNSRTHTPVVSHVIFLILGGVIMSYIYNLVPGYITLTLAGNSGSDDILHWNIAGWRCLSMDSERDLRHVSHRKVQDSPYSSDNGLWHRCHVVQCLDALLLHYDSRTRSNQPREPDLSNTDACNFLVLVRLLLCAALVAEESRH